MGDYDGKVMVITGASEGIGAALAVQVAQRGGRVVLAARRQAKLDEVAARIGDAARAVPTDVTEGAQVQRLLDEAVRAFGGVDVWVNNAGRGITRPVSALGDEDIDAMVRDNLKSALYGMQVALGHFAARGEGAIVNVSSMLARMAMAPLRSAYSASKAALNSLTESLRAELAETQPRLRVVCVMPGVVATGFGANAMHGGPDSRALPGAQPVEEVARVIADAALTANGDVYTRPEALGRVVGYLEALARARS
jgi:short-subunit dehydrogenase